MNIVTRASARSSKREFRTRRIAALNNAARTKPGSWGPQERTGCSTAGNSRVARADWIEFPFEIRAAGDGNRRWSISGFQPDVARPARISSPDSRYGRECRCERETRIAARRAEDWLADPDAYRYHKSVRNPPQPRGYTLPSLPCPPPSAARPESVLHTVFSRRAEEKSRARGTSDKLTRRRRCFERHAADSRFKCEI